MRRDINLLNSDGTQKFYKMPMRSAYCSYQDCADTTIYPMIWPGGKCPKCGKPLSWSGEEEVKVELGQYDQYGRKKFRTEKRRRKPLGKVTPGKVKQA